MKLTKGQLVGAFAVAVAGLGTLFTNYKPEIDHEPVKLSARAEARAERLHTQPFSLLRMAGGGDAEESILPASPQVEENAPISAGLESMDVLNAFGGVLIKEAMNEKLSPIERLNMMQQAMGFESFGRIAENMGITPEQLAQKIRTAAMQDIETLQKEIAVNPDDPLGNITQLVAIQKGLQLAGIQPDGKILKAYGEQMVGVTDAEISATIQDLKAQALPAATKEAEFNVALSVKQMTQHGLTRMIVVADLVTSAHKANVANGGSTGDALITPADTFAESVYAQMTEARQELFNRYETMVIKNLQPATSAPEPRIDTQSPFAPPKRGG